MIRIIKMASGLLKTNDIMGKKIKHIRFWVAVPPWIFIGAVAVLLPIFSFITIDNIHRQKINSARLLLEKGAALIRSFEAGTRTGLMGKHWSASQLQNLMAETALQPDIVHLLVVDVNGVTLAHNDLSKIGETYGRELNLEALSRSKKITSRIINQPDGQKVFEVIRRFLPTGGVRARSNALRMFEQLYRPHMSRRGYIIPTGYIIFVGLDMNAIEEAGRADSRDALILASVLVMIGFAGIILLFLAHNYQNTKDSLSRIKAFSDNLVEHMPIGLIALDSKKKIASLNHVAERILFLSAESVVGGDAADILPTEIYALIENEKIKTGIIEKEIECYLEEDKNIPLEASATMLTDEQGVFLGYVLLFKDLTEVRSLRREIARSQRLVSVGRLAAGVAHEIRNPLSSIKGFATYFKERYHNIPEDQQTAEIMIQEVDRLNRVVGQLLDFAKPIAITKSNINIQKVLENALQLIQREARQRNIHIKTKFPQVLPDVYADPDKMSQVFLNLYLNAIESMTNGGTLSVEVYVNKNQNGLSVTVSDTGSGIDEKDLNHIFDPYFTTKNSGTGIGLSIVHNIMEAHSGEIHVKSRKDIGSTFRVLLRDVIN